MADVADTVAPWAEVVPGAGPATVEDLLTMPNDGWIYEVVEGVLVASRIPWPTSLMCD
jgi:hypothetical protein